MNYTMPTPRESKREMRVGLCVPPVTPRHTLLDWRIPSGLDFVLTSTTVTNCKYDLAILSSTILLISCLVSAFDKGI